MCLIASQECGFVFTPTRAVAEWQWSNESWRFWCDTCRLLPGKNSSVTLVTVPLVMVLLLLIAVPVTVMLQQKKRRPAPLLPFPAWLSSGPIWYKRPQFCTFTNEGKFFENTYFFPWTHHAGERMVFLSCNAPLAVLSALFLCLQDSLFLQQPLSRSVLN